MSDVNNSRYLFRGKRIDNGKWAYGYLLSENFIGEITDSDDEGSPIVTGDFVEVDPSTVGQLLKKDKFSYFEGDLLRSYESGIGVVEYDPLVAQAVVRYGNGNWQSLFGFLLNEPEKYKVPIGNIWDNPDLLK